MQMNDMAQRQALESGQMKATFEELMNNMQNEVEAKREVA